MRDKNIPLIYENYLFLLIAICTSLERSHFRYKNTLPFFVGLVKRIKKKQDFKSLVIEE